MDVVHNMSRAQPKTFFADGIRKFVDRNYKRVEKLGEESKNGNICVLVYF